VCGSLEPTGALVTEGRAPGQAANVGVNGGFSAAAGTSIGGSMRANGAIETTGDMSVDGHLFSRGSISTVGSLRVGGDLAAGGDLDAVGTLDVGGALRVAGSASHVGPGGAGSRGAFSDPGTSPCGCEAPYDVRGAVAIARTANDNAAHDLSPAGIPTVGETEITLPSGRYYLAGLESVGARRVVVTGAVQLYIDGDLSHVGDDRFTLAPGATLDLFVAGALESVGSIELGDPDRPEAFRLYVGGEGRIAITGSARFAGLVYAPNADLEMAGDAVVEGGLFARNVSYAGTLTIRYAPVTTQGDACEEPSVPAPPSTNGCPTVR
jgi:hypothetical protein